MTEQIKKLVQFIVTLETYLSEYDEFSSLHMANVARLELLRRYATGDNIPEQVSILDQRAKEAQDLANGAEARLALISGKPTAEDARQMHLQLRTVLTTLMDTLSDEFKAANGLDGKTSEDILSFGLSLVPQKSN